MVRKHYKPAPAEISYKNMKFLITEQPKDTTITNFISTLKKHKVTHIVCATDRVYRIDDLEEVALFYESKTTVRTNPRIFRSGM